MSLYSIKQQKFVRPIPQATPSINTELQNIDWNFRNLEHNGKKTYKTRVVTSDLDLTMSMPISLIVVATLNDTNITITLPNPPNPEDHVGRQFIFTRQFMVGYPRYNFETSDTEDGNIYVTCAGNSRIMVPKMFDVGDELITVGAVGPVGLLGPITDLNQKVLTFLGVGYDFIEEDTSRALWRASVWS